MSSKQKLKHVPTVPELVEMGLATGHEPSKAGNPKWYKVSPKGYKLIKKAMSHNAPIMREAEAAVAEARKPLLKAERHRRRLIEKGK